EVLGAGPLCLGDGRSLVQHAQAEGLGALAAVGYAKFNACSGLELRDALGQRGLGQEDFLAVLASEESEAFFLVIPLDLAGRHVINLLRSAGTRPAVTASAWIRGFRV